MTIEQLKREIERAETNIRQILDDLERLGLGVRRVEVDRVDASIHGEPRPVDRIVGVKIRAEL
jgi:hypothetical protein